MILGKLGLSEYANSFGNQPSGFPNLTGQVLHGFDADQNPSGSSSGSGTAGAAALSMLTIGTETNGSIISPSGAQSLVGIRPTVGLVPGLRHRADLGVAGHGRPDGAHRSPTRR